MKPAIFSLVSVVICLLILPTSPIEWDYQSEIEENISELDLDIVQSKTKFGQGFNTGFDTGKKDGTYCHNDLISLVNMNCQKAQEEFKQAVIRYNYYKKLQKARNKKENKASRSQQKRRKRRSLKVKRLHQTKPEPEFKQYLQQSYLHNNLNKNIYKYKNSQQNINNPVIQSIRPKRGISSVRQFRQTMNRFTKICCFTKCDDNAEEEILTTCRTEHRFRIWFLSKLFKSYSKQAAEG